mgnify:FL=1
MTKREIMKRAHELAKTYEGHYRARISLGLKEAWAEAHKEGAEMRIEKNGFVFEFRNFEWHPYILEAEYKVVGIEENKINDGYFCGAKFDSYRGVMRFEFTANGKDLKGLKVPEPFLTELKELESQLKQEYYTEKERKDKEEMDSLMSGKTLIKVVYHDGEYLSGWKIYNEKAADILIELGLAHEVSGWGTSVNDDVVEALGEEFTYQQAEEYAQPALKVKAQAKAEKEAEKQAKFDEAKATGKPVELYRYSEECNDHLADCTLDLIIGYAMPDGTTKEERVHTY